MTTATFYDHPMMLMLAMKDAEDGGSVDFAGVAYLQARGLDGKQSALVLDRLQDDGLINFKGKKNGNGTYGAMFDLQLTAGGLKQLALWPSGSPDIQLLLERVLAELDEGPELQLTTEEEKQLSGLVEQLRGVSVGAAGGFVARVLAAAVGLGV